MAMRAAVILAVLLAGLLTLPLYAESGLVVAVMPAGLTGSALLNVFLLIFLFGYLGQCWNILGGYAGQLSLGHAAYVGVGAYTSSLLYVNLGVSPWIGMLAGAGLAGVFGLVIGALSFRYRLSGPFFALATIAFAELIRLAALHLEFTGGSLGVLIPLSGDSFWQFQFTDKAPYYYIALAMMVAVTALVFWISRSRLGYYLHAIRQDEQAAAAIGIDTTRYKLIATTLSAALTGAGGTFYAQYTQYIVPDDIFAVSLSIEIILRTIFGGAATVFGPIVGSFLLTPVAEATRILFAEGGSGATVVKMFASDAPVAEKFATYLGFLANGGGGGGALFLYGVVLVAVCVGMPHGVLPWFLRRFGARP
jgi:branched-chain amino acid transport system permease protein